jgi:hypothetical protein
MEVGFRMSSGMERRRHLRRVEGSLISRYTIPDTPFTLCLSWLHSGVA